LDQFYFPVLRKSPREFNYGNPQLIPVGFAIFSMT